MSKVFASFQSDEKRSLPEISIETSNFIRKKDVYSSVQAGPEFQFLAQMSQAGVITFFNYFGAVFALMLAFGQFVRKWSINHLILGGLFVALSVTVFYFTMIDSHDIFKVPVVLFANIPFLYLLGPLTYLYVTMVTTEDFRWKPVRWLHFLPALVSLVFLYPFFTMEVSEKVEILESIIYHNDMSLARSLMAAPVLLLIFYLGYLGYSNNPFLNYRDKKSYVVTGLLLFWIGATGTGGMVLLLGNVYYMKFAIIFINLSIFYIYLLGQRDPRFLNAVTSEIRRKKYEKSLLENIDVNELEKHIEELFDMGIHRDEEITLRKMAGMLKITPHQLSQFLNERQKMNFNSFINRHRIEDAKKILIDQPDMAVIGVAYEVGFKSLSSFHEAFRRFYGSSPSEYRKEFT